MRKLDFLSLILCTYYIASVFQSSTLMVLVVMECLFFPILFIQSWGFKKHVSILFMKHRDTVQKREPYSCLIQASNKGRIPVNQFQIKMKVGYDKEKKKSVKIYGGAKSGEHPLWFQIRAPYCGMLTIEMKTILFYDYLFLFCTKKKHRKEEMKIAVFPQKRVLQIEFSSFMYNGSYLEEETLRKQLDDGYQEIRQLREYVTGDPIRFIHWNQSARTGKLWIKEYETETDFFLDLFLDTRLVTCKKVDLEQLDAFYEIVSALLLGILKHAAFVRVHWYDKTQMDVIYMEIQNEQQIEELLEKLYLLDWKKPDAIGSQKILERMNAWETDCLSLNLDLEWYYGKNVVYRFSKTRLEEEITKEVFQL